MITTQNIQAMPGVESVKRICKAVAVLDAIICPDWEFRYYSYNSKWSENEAFFEMRNGEGSHMLILFREEGCVINGFCPECKQPGKSKLTAGLPEVFKEFIFGEPVKT